MDVVGRTAGLIQYNSRQLNDRKEMSPASATDIAIPVEIFVTANCMPMA